MLLIAALAKTGTTLRSLRPMRSPSMVSSSLSSMFSKNFSMSSSVAPAAVSIRASRSSSTLPASEAGTATFAVLPPLVWYAML